jgi:hypothetical protein
MLIPNNHPSNSLTILEEESWGYNAYYHVDMNKINAQKQKHNLLPVSISTLTSLG